MREIIGADATNNQFLRSDLQGFGFNPRTIDTLERLPQDRDTLVQSINDLTGDVNLIEGEPILTFQPTALSDPILTNTRQLIGSGNVTFDVGASEAVLDLTDTGVDANTYGEPTRILVLAIDAKGRITNAEEIKLDVSDVDGILKVTHGGTNLSSYTTGDLLYASGSTTIAKLADVAVGNVLKSGGVGNAPAYGQVALGSDVSGVLPEANGGFPAGGFTGSGIYTLFTIVDGLITAAS